MSAEKSSDVGKLQSAIADMDCIATDAFGQISVIAKLALAAMENPNARISLEDYAKAFTAIWSKADDGYDSVGSAAENVGCGYTDTVRRYREESETKKEVR